jgi:sigma-B regulation protein RsbU (phosphoserine phosphatase)
MHPSLPVSPPKQPDRPVGEGARILVVDDVEGNRDSLSRRLLRRGYVVDVAADGESALEMVERLPIELILLDVMMPGINGLEVLSRIRQTRPATELPIIMVTARDGSDDVVNALTAGANDYVTKPLDFAVVIARIQTQLELRAAVQQVFALERHLVRRNADLERANSELRRAAARTRRELLLATKVQASFLPKEPPVAEGLQFAWRYEPSVELAGDALNICRLTDDALGLYLLDVSGHGVAASLTAVSAARLLSGGGEPDTILVRDRIPVSPSEVALRLGQSFAWNAETEQFMTMFYAMLEPASGMLHYVSAGHPPAIRISRDGIASRLDGSGMPIGIGESFEHESLQLDPGDRIYLYSDGVIETSNADDDHFGIARLCESLGAGRSTPLNESINALMDQLHHWRGGGKAIDDVSVLAFQFDRN